MELQEETESVPSAEDGEDAILRGDSVVRPPSDGGRTLLESVRRPKTLLQSVLRGAGCHIPNRKRPSVNRSKQLSKPSWNKF
jgi:hypothetical protein